MLPRRCLLVCNRALCFQNCSFWWNKRMNIPIGWIIAIYATFNCKVSGVVNGNSNLWTLLPLSIIRADGAVYVSAVGSSAPLPFFWVETRSWRQILHNLAVHRVDLLETLPDTVNVVGCHVLLTSAGDSIMVLNNANNIKHLSLSLHHTLD